MTDSSQHVFDRARRLLLDPSGLDTAQLEGIMGGLVGPGIDFADLYFQSSRRESWSVEDGIVKDGSHVIEQGVGVRAISGEKTGFAYSDALQREAVNDAAQIARSIARQGQSATVSRLQCAPTPVLYPPLDPLDGMATSDKIAVLRQVDRWLRAADPRIIQVMVSLSGGVDTILVARSDGVLAADIRPLVRMNVQVVMQDAAGRRESGYAGGGGRYGYAELFAQERAIGFARQALRQAELNLSAIAAPAGIMPVVLGAGWPGILLHEAVGHGLEGDFNRKGTSVFAGRIGERVASAGVTVVDDGTLVGRRGSLCIDDEGTPSQSTPLIEDGVLVGYMQDTLNARLMKSASTGNGRRESFAHLTMPRMTNTYMLNGKQTREEMIRSVKKGLYAANFGGGQVDITSGKYVFSTTEAYIIENGKITAPVKGATLIGSGLETMQRVQMIGDDMALDEGVGICGKDGQSVPVGVGQPSLLIDGLTVGGTVA